MMIMKTNKTLLMLKEDKELRDDSVKFGVKGAVLGSVLAFAAHWLWVTCA